MTVQQKGYDGFECHALDERHCFSTGRVPEDLVLTPEHLEILWSLHPPQYHRIKIHGRVVATPRWQQAYGADSHYTGRVNEALPTPPLLAPLLEWAQAAIDGRLGHSIGAHRDSTKHMVAGTPIVTVSLGEERAFRLRPWKGSGYRDFRATHGSVFIMPYDTNQAWMHEVPHAANYRGHRISITLGAFTSGGAVAAERA